MPACKGDATVLSRIVQFWIRQKRIPTSAFTPAEYLERDGFSEERISPTDLPPDIITIALPNRTKHHRSFLCFDLEVFFLH